MKRKITIIVSIIYFGLNNNVIAQNSNFLWAKQMVGITVEGIGPNQGNSIAVDVNGNVYTTGNFYGTTDFDPGTGIYNMTSAGSSDIFISKLDASGNFLWAKQFGGGGFDQGKSVAVDNNGNVYIAGNFQYTGDFDPGDGVYNLDFSYGNISICKLDASGNFLWAKQFGNGYSALGSITLDTDGNIYTTGSFPYTADFDPGTGTFNITSVGGPVMFVSKLDASGNFLWAIQLGGSATTNCYGSSIAVDL